MANNSQQAPASGKIETVSNKMEGMRRALKDLGKNAKPDALQAHLKERFGLEMKKDLISKYKSDILTKKGGKKKKKAKGAAKTTPGETAATTPVAAKKGSNGTGRIRLEDILEVKALVHRVGADQLRALIGALVK